MHSNLLITLTPILALLGVMAVVGALTYAFHDKAIAATSPFALKFKDQLERAHIQVRAEELSIGLIAATVIIWALIVFLLHLNVLFAFGALAAVGFLVFKAFGMWLDHKIAQRLAAFNGQFELVLRMISSGIRAGLGLRQALIMVTEEMADPARYEFNLTVMQTNIGMSTSEALARLATRMPSAEMEMFTRAIIVQSQTGGNLGKTLDNLAQTIKQRRALFRKVKAMTAEARASAMVIAFLPVAIAAFLLSSQPDWREQLMGTSKGHIILGIATGLELTGIYVLSRLIAIKV